MTVTSAGLAVIFAAIAGICMWKGHGTKLPAWLALIAGMCGAATVTGLLGGLAGASFLGVGIVTLVAFAGAFLFWLEAVKGKGHHKIRTPVVGLLAGAALVTQFTGLQHVVQHGTTNLTSVITQHSGTGR